MKILLSGYTGRMGHMVQDSIQKGNEIVSYVAVDGKEDEIKHTHTSFDAVKEEVDVVIDFSNHQNTEKLLDFCLKRKLPCVICTTGQEEKEKEKINEASKKIPIFFSANMSLGVATLCKLVKQAVRVFPDADIEIVETHHNRKIDVPSGTALYLAQAIQQENPKKYICVGRNESGKRNPDEITIHSLRMGNECGTHTVYIHTDNECIKLEHEAESRAVFAQGALEAAAFLLQQKEGLYSMQDMLGE